jgi:hypothetical protein
MSELSGVLERMTRTDEGQGKRREGRSGLARRGDERTGHLSRQGCQGQATARYGGIRPRSCGRKEKLKKGDRGGWEVCGCAMTSGSKVGLGFGGTLEGEGGSGLPELRLDWEELS